MILRQWALKHGVSLEAVLELEAAFGIGRVPPVQHGDGELGSEARVASQVLIEAGKRGIFLTRNNVGALQDVRGRVVRYGLANETKQRNAVIKSGDLIGIKPLLIGPEHVGQVVGQFASVETKAEGWQFTGTPHERAQLAWVELVTRLGGFAKFVSRVDQL